MPREIVDRLNRDINAVLARPEVRANWRERNAFDLQGGSPEDLAAFLHAQYQTWGRAIAEPASPQ